jgi:hypothetical protein
LGRRPQYLVKAWKFKRYAPINKFRVPGQVYHEGPRSLAYLTADEAKTKAAKETVSAKAEGDIISLSSKSEGKQQVIPAARVPQEGLVVWDGDVDQNGTVKDFHVGDAVEDVGIELPTLENREKWEKVRTAHAALKAAQIAGSALLDYDLNEFMKRLKAKLISQEDPVFLEDLSMEESIAEVMKNLGTAPAGFDKTLPLLIDLWRSGNG